jgi:catechol 2,3-dioxygenase-like lactoylglutathione lyase family enzyme
MTTKDIRDKLGIHIEGLQIILSVTDMNASRAFYKEILGFEEVDWGSDDFTSVNRENAGIYLCKGAQGNPGTWFWVGFGGDIFKLHDDLKAKGVKIRKALTNYSWAMEMQVEDPDGHVLRFGTEPNNNEPFVDDAINGEKFK